MITDNIKYLQLVKVSKVMDEAKLLKKSRHAILVNCACIGMKTTIDQTIFHQQTITKGYIRSNIIYEPEQTKH